MVRTTDIKTSAPAATERAGTGIAGLDEILGGGLPPNHLYLLDGEPGIGTPTAHLRVLLGGVSKAEEGLYVTLCESRAELEGVAGSDGWSLDGVEIFELAEQGLGQTEDNYAIFHPVEVVLQSTVD